MTPSLEGPRRKIARAYKHVRDLDSLRTGFLDTKPYHIAPENDPKTGDRVFRIRDIKEFFGPWFAVITGDAIHNMRSALDLLVWQLVLANKEQPSNVTAFPIMDSATKLKGVRNAQIKGCSTKAMRLIERLKPYQRGNPSLWRLHRLDIADKHHLLLPVGMTFKGTRFQGWLGPDLQAPLYAKAKRHTFALKEGAILWRILKAWRNNPKVDMNPEFEFEIAFGKIERLSNIQGRPVVQALNEILDAVEESVERFAPFFS